MEKNGSQTIEDMEMSLEEETDLRASVQYAVLELCRHEDSSTNTTTSPEAVKAISELTYAYATQILKKDLDSFASHASRRSINASDVTLVVRKNQSLRKSLEQFLEGFQLQDSTISIDRPKKRRPPTVNLQKKRTESPVDEESDSSSSSDDELRRALNARTTRKKESLLSDSDDDNKASLPNTKTKPKSILDDSDEEDAAIFETSLTSRLKQYPRSNEPKPRFRFSKLCESNKKATTQDIENGDEDSSAADTGVKDATKKKPSSRFETMFTGLSDDSVDE